jgi:flagellar biosynthesis GTPase FlhF
LNLVKQELGPDAIILKTITNKGLKGAFKKSRIEITAAISEESYAKKSKVDKVFSKEQKSDFYKSSASDINKSITSYNQTQNKPQAQNQGQGGYGNMGLNKVVNTVSKASKKLKHSLDDFLGTPEDEANIPVVNEAYATSEDNDDYILSDMSDFTDDEHEEMKAHTQSAPVSTPAVDMEIRNEVQVQKNKIKMLENKIDLLLKEMENKNFSDTNEENSGLAELKTTLKTADLSDKIIQDISKKALFELSKEELNHRDTVFEFALSTIHELINVDMPLFSKPEVDGAPVVTALVSDGAIGQSSMAIKLAVLNSESRVIKYRTNEVDDNKTDFAAKLFNIKYSVSNSLPSMLSEIRKSISNGESVILDIKTSGQEMDASRKILETLKRSFEHIEVLVTTSAINSEVYNRKIVSKYKDFSDGVIISYVDQCMSFGSLLNVHYANLDLPLKFFGTGQTIPDDIEAATAERILAAMFRL